MNIYPSKQLAALLASLLVGFGNGMIYDILAEIRHRKNSGILTVICDFLFCICLFTVLFFVGYTIDEGRQKLYYILFAFIGAGLYFILIREVMQKIISIMSDFIIYTIRVLLYPLILLKNTLKKLWKIFKNIFKYNKKCYKIKNRIIIPLIHSSHIKYDPVKEKTNETEKGRYYY